jgi:malonate decarboxylase holo-[acyl-carrier-protein] synthase
MISFNRHDLVWLSKAGKEYALENIQSCIPKVSERDIKDVILGKPPIPAIVRRQDITDKGLLCIGFSSHRIICTGNFAASSGIRLRIGSIVPLDYIEKHITPFDVIKFDMRHFPQYKLLEALIDEGNNCNIQVGFFGSAALHIISGLPYWQETSDIDIYLRQNGTREELNLFYQHLLKLEKNYRITIDAEIEFRQYGVKLKELMQPGKTVLGKGLYDVALLEKSHDR